MPDCVYEDGDGPPSKSDDSGSSVKNMNVLSELGLLTHVISLGPLKGRLK